MAKLVFQFAVQKSYQSDGLNPGKLCGLLADYASKIFGGIWLGGYGPYCYECIGAAEMYVAHIEDLMVWIARPSTGGFGKVLPSGVVEICS